MNTRRRVAELLLEGYTNNKSIASVLGITESGVKQQLKRMYWHLGIDEGIKKVKLAVMLTQQPMLLEGLDTVLLEIPVLQKNKQDYRLRRKKK